MQTKVCCRCKLPKLLIDFPKSTSASYGVHSICKACKAVYMKEYGASGKLKISKEKYKQTEKGKNKIKDYRRSESNKRIQKAWRKSAEGNANSKSKLAQYRARLKKAMPSWITPFQLYLVYKNCPMTLEVDHIVPLQGKNVCGLHVPWNLQYLSRSQNAVKSNSFDGTSNNDSWKFGK